MNVPIDKQKLMEWLSGVEDSGQLDALRSFIANAQHPQALWEELSSAAQQTIRRGGEPQEMDIHLTREEFWELVWSMRESSKKVSWEDLPEAVKEGIRRGQADVKAGRVYTHKEIMSKFEERLRKK